MNQDGAFNNLDIAPFETDLANGTVIYVGHSFLIGFGGMVRDDETGLLQDHARYYDPKNAIFISQDPTGFATGSTNLSAYVGNDSPNAIDPSGLDFVGVADRSVNFFPLIGGSLHTVFHYSLEYWRSCDRWGEGTLKIYHGLDTLNLVGTNKLASVELIARSGFEAWSFTTTDGINARWERTPVTVSEVVYNNDSGENVSPIFEGSRKATRAVWTRVIAAARSYRWAEQQGFDAGPTFVNWPRSLYDAVGTNSNTFVRDTVSRAGLTMVELSGSHPGAMTPSQNSQYETTFFRHQRIDHTFYAQEPPWTHGWFNSPGRPKPTWNP